MIVIIIKKMYTAKENLHVQLIFCVNALIWLGEILAAQNEVNPFHLTLICLTKGVHFTICGYFYPELTFSPDANKEDLLTGRKY